MNILPLSPFSPPPLLQMGLLRRKLRAEFCEMREKIVESRLNDEMTLEIKNWQKRFSASLKLFSDEDQVCNTYIRLLQELLTDPITNAPLDANAVIGSDGYTYGQMSLAVYWYAIPAEQRNRSPLDATDPTPFRVAPHPVVRHMMGWLRKHNAMLYSEELERAYLQLLPSQQPIHREDRINQIIAHQQELDRIEATRRSAQFQAFDQRLQHRMQRWNADLERLASLRNRANEPLASLGVQSQADLLLAQNRLNAIAANDQIAAEVVAANLDRSFREEQIRVEEVQQQLHLSQDQDRISIAELQTRIVEHLGPNANSLLERLHAHANATLERTQTTALREEEALQVLEQSIQKLDEKITRLEEKTLVLAEKIAHTSSQLILAKQEEMILQKEIQETQVAIKKFQKKKKEKLFSTITRIGVSVFSTWAIQSVLYSTGMSGAILPEQGGATFNLKLRI